MTYKKFRTLDDFNVRGKNVLLRVDLNSQVINKSPILSSRIKEHAKTISELKKKKAKIIVIAHQSRPGKPDFISLKKHASLLNKFVKIRFISDVIGKKAEIAIKKLKEGEAILLENVRYLKDEYNLKRKNKIHSFFKNKLTYMLMMHFNLSS